MGHPFKFLKEKKHTHTQSTRRIKSLKTYMVIELEKHRYRNMSLANMLLETIFNELQLYIKIIVQFEFKVLSLFF